MAPVGDGNMANNASISVSPSPNRLMDDSTPVAENMGIIGEFWAANVGVRRKSESAAVDDDDGEDGARRNGVTGEEDDAEGDASLLEVSRTARSQSSVLA